MIYECTPEIIDGIGTEATTFPYKTYTWCKPYCMFIVNRSGNIKEKTVTVRDFGMVYYKGVVFFFFFNLQRIMLLAFVFGSIQIKD